MVGGRKIEDKVKDIWVSGDVGFAIWWIHQVVFFTTP